MSKELLNKAIASCFAKIARVDGSIGKEELDVINSSEILKKYGGSIEGIDTKDFFNNIQNQFGEVIKNNLQHEEKEILISDLVSLIKADDKVHDHEFFLLGHVANSIGFSPERVSEIIKTRGLSGKSSGWFSWLFG